SFAVENSSYTGCLSSIGVAPEGAKRYYSIGFRTAPNAVTCGPTGGLTCLCFSYGMVGTALACNTGSTCTDTDNSTIFRANSTVASGAAVPTTVAIARTNVPATGVSQSACAVGAGGNVSGCVRYDYWPINEAKNLANTQAGI